MARGDVAADSSLVCCLEMLADPALLAQASDGMLAQLLMGLLPLLRYNRSATAQWCVGPPGSIPGILGPLQHACQASGCCHMMLLQAVQAA